MSAIEFEPFPKIPRLNRTITITEKIDGTNAAVLIVEVAAADYTNTVREEFDELGNPHPDSHIVAALTNEAADTGWLIFAQSRSRFITPGRDNYGFAGWVQRNAAALVDALGPGRHFGEWWGAGIQRKYGLTGPDKRFWLFNTKRWHTSDAAPTLSTVPGLGIVPVLYEGPYRQTYIDAALALLANRGSVAQPGFARPEGIVVYHHALRSQFKITLEGDEAPKGAAGHALDEERSAA